MKWTLIRGRRKVRGVRSEMFRQAAMRSHSRRSVRTLKCILVPTDFSPCCRKAIRYAVSFALDHHAGIILLHVLEDAAANDELLRKKERELEILARQEVPGRVSLTTLLRVGDPLCEIINQAKARRVDLLVMANDARAGLPDFCLTSVAEQIVHYAPCPVLVVREEGREFV